jgi:hypothetical protein
MTHAPTSSGPPLHVPTTCWCCGRRANGAGIGEFPSARHPKADPKFLCDLCIPLAAQIRASLKFDHYERAAIEAAIESVGPLIGEYGTDLAEWTDDQRKDFVTQIILFFGASIREQVKNKEVPF